MTTNKRSLITILTGTLATMFLGNDLIAQRTLTGQKAETEGTLELVNDQGLFTASDVANASRPGSTYTSVKWANNAAVTPLIIDTGLIGADQYATIQEDMRIMNHLLTEAVGRANSQAMAWASGIVLDTGQDAKSRQNIYLSDIGAIFFLSVPFPLSGPENAKTVKKSAPKNTAWERARKQVYGNEAQNHYYSLGNQTANTLTGILTARSHYDATKVDDLVETLCETLANAANIRTLGKEETVWVVVSGPGNASQQNPSQFIQSYHLPQGQNATLAQTMLSGFAMKQSGLTIAARKADIDDLNDGTISLKEF